jgi:hypothetical protein
MRNLRIVGVLALVGLGMSGCTNSTVQNSKTPSFGTVRGQLLQRLNVHRSASASGTIEFQSNGDASFLATANSSGAFSIRLKSGHYVGFVNEMGGLGAFPTCPEPSVVVKGGLTDVLRLSCRINGTVIRQGFVNPLSRLAITSADAKKVGLALSPAPSPTIVQISSKQVEINNRQDYPSNIAPKYGKPFLVVVTRSGGFLNQPPTRLLCWAIVWNATIKGTFTNIVDNSVGSDWTVTLFSAYTGEPSGGFTGHSAIRL